MAAVVIENLSKTFRGPRGETIRAVGNFCLAVEDKECLTLVGPSGCGKTTLLRLIAGLEQPDSGSITLHGQNADRISPANRDVALVFQNGALYPHMTAHENMAFPLSVRRVPRPEAESRIRETAQMLGLMDCLSRRPAELSGGQRQRVALGRALVRRPKLLLLDEPLSNLDEPLRAEMRRELLRLHSRLGATLIHVTHDQEEALALGHRVAVMSEGTLQQVDTPAKLYHRPANLFVARFIGSPPMNLLPGEIVRDAQGAAFKAPAPAGAETAAAYLLRLTEESAARFGNWRGGPVVLGLRPEAVSLVSADRLSISDWFVEAVVESVEPVGHETRLHLIICGVAWIARVPSNEAPGAGRRITVLLDQRTACFFDAASGLASR